MYYEGGDITSPKYEEIYQVGTSPKLRKVHISEKNVHMSYVQK